MDNSTKKPQEPKSNSALGTSSKSKQHFDLCQMVDDGNGELHEMKIGSLSTGDLGLISGETLYGKFVLREPKI